MVDCRVVRNEPDGRLDSDEDEGRARERDVVAALQLPEHDRARSRARGDDARAESCGAPHAVEDQHGDDALERERRQPAREEQAPGRLRKLAQAARRKRRS